MLRSRCACRISVWRDSSVYASSIEPETINSRRGRESKIEVRRTSKVGERRLCEQHGEWLFVTGFPMAKRPFYTHPQPDRPEYSNSFDLLFRGMEIVTGGQRLHRFEDYVTALNGETEPYESYLQAFRYGMPPHGGFALGLERWTAQLIDVRNIRETTLFPRDLNRLSP